MDNASQNADPLGFVEQENQIALQMGYLPFQNGENFDQRNQGLGVQISLRQTPPWSQKCRKRFSIQKDKSRGPKMVCTPKIPGLPLSYVIIIRFPIKNVKHRWT